MAYPLILLAALNGLLVVIIGAFMAHALKPIMAAELIKTFETGVLYHMLHTIALFGISILSLHFPGERLLKLSAYSFFLGIIFFSGSLYFLALTEIRGIGIITPIGGLFFLSGWGMLCLFGSKSSSQT